MSIHAWVEHIDVVINHKNAKKMIEDMKLSGFIAQDINTAKDYFLKNLCEISSDKKGIRITNINIDVLHQELYNFLESIEKYIVSGSLIKFRSEGGGWGIAMYANDKLVPYGDLVLYQQIDKEVEESKEWGSRGHDGNTYVYDDQVTEEKLNDYRYWRHGCLALSLLIAAAGESVAPLKGAKKKLIEDFHSLSRRANEILVGEKTLTKHDVNSFKEYSLQYSKRLLELKSIIEKRPDAGELMIIK
jgi:hypothetical protein